MPPALDERLVPLVWAVTLDHVLGRGPPGDEASQGRPVAQTLVPVAEAKRGITVALRQRRRSWASWSA